jgi:hypothetical protein
MSAGKSMMSRALFAMHKCLVALLLSALPAFAEESSTAYEALRTVGQQVNRDSVNHVVSVVGTNGSPQPESWKILIDDPKARGGVREFEVGSGRIISERAPVRSSVEGSLGPVIDTAKLNLDSSGAYTLAQQTAKSSHVTFATADYTLRVDERGNPIWKITLLRQSGEPAGTIFIGANHGTVTRTEGLFAGGDRAAIEEPGDQGERENADENADDDDDEGNVVERRIKHTFFKVRDDVKRTFFKVRRSFIDFFRDV